MLATAEEDRQSRLEYNTFCPHGMDFPALPDLSLPHDVTVELLFVAVKFGSRPFATGPKSKLQLEPGVVARSLLVCHHAEIMVLCPCWGVSHNPHPC